MMRRCEKGSLTIEAAVALPLFMTGLLTFVSMLLMQLTAMRIQASVHDTAKKLIETLADGHSIATSSVKDMMQDALSDWDLRFVKNGKEGLDMSDSDIDDPEYIILDVRCRLIPLTDCFGALSIPLERRCMAHVWCGYDREFFPDDEYVYITNDSEVFHCDRECSHIRLTVTKTSSDMIGTLRNNSGAKYRPCEYCHPKASDTELYITPEGDRYHKSITCSGLKRTVRAIRRSETGDRRPCSRCGR